MSDRVLHLVVPGLLGPLPGRVDDAPWRQGPAPVRLETCLARADRDAVPLDAEALLFRLFGLDVPADADLPSAALACLADSGQPPAGVVYHATPVHLRPDQDRLLLFDAPSADLDEAEAAAFVQAFNAHFAADGWRLSAPVAGRWYLHVDTLPALRTHPLGEAIGRNIDLFLPEGPDARAWRQRLNEVQMLFHGLAVNQQRQARGCLPVSGLWLHGGGALPPAPPVSLQLAGEVTPLLRGLQLHARGEPAGRLHWLDDARRALWDADPAAWWRAVQRLEAALAGLHGPWRLYPGDGHGYDWRPAMRWRLWRRRRPLAQRLLRD